MFPDLRIVTGHARACTTLMCNILTDNPGLRASSTSAVPEWLVMLRQSWSNSPDVREMFSRDPSGEECRATLQRMVRALVEARHYHPGEEKTVIFDKSRNWMLAYDLARAAYPKLKMIVMVRDLRSIIASCERPLRAQGFLADGRAATFNDRLTQYLSEDPIPDHTNRGVGLIGGPLIGIRDLLQRGDGTILDIDASRPKFHKHVLFVRAEDLQVEPKIVMQHVYRFMGEPDWHPEHNYEDVGNHATDPDHLWFNMYQHDGHGKIEKRAEKPWEDMMSPDVADAIIQKPELLWYHKRFRYIDDPHLGRAARENASAKAAEEAHDGPMMHRRRSVMEKRGQSRR